MDPIETTAAPVADTSVAAPAVVTETVAPVAAPAPVTTEAAVTPVASTDWRSTITDPELKEFASRLATPADAVKVAADLRRANSSMVRVPGKDAKPEDIAKFNKLIGVPETVDGYKYDLGREPTEADKAIQGKLSEAALAAGVPANAMGALAKVVSELAASQKTEQDRVAVEGRAAAEASLRKEWGADYEANKTLASRAVQAFGEVKSHPEVIEFFDKTMVNGQKLGDHPVMIRMLGNIGRRMGEGDFIGAVGGSERQNLQTELRTLMDQNPPGSAKYSNPDVQRRVREINETLHGTGSR